MNADGETRRTRTGWSGSGLEAGLRLGILFAWILSGAIAASAVTDETSPVSDVITNLDTALRLTMREAERGRAVRAPARVTCSHPEPCPIPFQLRGAIAKAATPFSFKAAEKGLAWHFRVASEVPDWVHLDPDRLSQILGNPLGNAVRFTDTGSISLAVKLAPGNPDTENVALVLFTIADTGPGVLPGHVGRLLLPFSQVNNSSTRRFGGTGLGLGVCKQLAELMGGRIGVHSQPGIGSRFWVEPPLRRATPPHPDTAPQPSPPSAAVSP